MEERPAVLGMRSTVDLQHGRIHAVRVVTLRFEDPALQPPAVGSGEVVLLRFGDVAVVQPWIQVGDPSLGPVREHEQLAWTARIRGAERDHAGRDVEVVDATQSAGLLAHVALKVDGMDRRHTGAAGEEVDPIALRRPADPGGVARAHVVDHAVVHRLVEVGGEAARPATGQRHDPEPLEQADVEPVGRDERDLVPLRRPDRRAEIEASAEAEQVGLQVDQVEVQLALQVSLGFGVAGHDEARAVGRPVVVRDVPCASGQLLGVATCRRDHEQVVVAAVDVSLPIVLVVEPAHDAGHGWTAQLLAAFGRPGVVHHRLRIGEDRADERDATAVRRPGRRRGALGHGAQLLGGAAGGDVEDEELVGGAHPAHKCELAAVRRPLGRVVAQRAARGSDWFGIEQSPHHDPAAVLPRARVGPADLIRDPLAVATQPNVVDPTKAIEVVESQRGRHASPRMLPAAADAYSARVPFRGKEKRQDLVLR